MRLIDADSLKDWECEKCEYENKDGYWCRESCGVMQRIDESPTIDEVPVVRCENCLYWNKENEMCNAFDAVTPYDGYCYFGMLWGV